MRVAVVGNGPLSVTDREEIKTYDKVVRFNNMRNWRKGERLDTLAIRQEGWAVNVGVLVTTSFLLAVNVVAIVAASRSWLTGSRVLSWVSLAAVLALIILELVDSFHHKSKVKIMDYPPEDTPTPKEIVVFGFDCAIVQVVQNRFPQATVHFQPINNKEIQFLGTNIKYETLDGPSTGFHMLAYLANHFPNDELHIYGMNWNFTATGAVSHSSQKERFHVYNTCQTCIVHPTPSDSYEI